LQLVLAGVYHVDVPPGNIPLAEVESLRKNPLIREVVPIAMGDSYRGFHIVGTEPAFLGLYGARLAGGVTERTLEAVLGAGPAARGPRSAHSAGPHGLVEGGEVMATIRTASSGFPAAGTVIDRLLTGVDSVWKAHEHGEEKSGAGEAAGADQAARNTHAEKPAAAQGAKSPWRWSGATPLAAASLPRQINSESSLQASPAYE
jgi:putative ABC transport system permease protein